MKTPTINYNLEKGMVYDFIAVMIHSLMFSDITSVYVESGKKPDEIISASYKRMRAAIKKRDSALLKLMFSLGQNGLSVFSSFHDLLMKSESVDELIDRLVNFDADLYFVRILGFFDIDHKFSYNFYNRIISDKELLMEYLNGLKMTAENRLAFMNFIEFPQLMFTEFKKDLTAIKKELEIEYEILKQYRLSFYEKLKEELKTHAPEEFYERFITGNDLNKDNAYDQIMVYATIYVPFAIQFMGDYRRLHIYFGMDFDKNYNSKKNTVIDISYIFKAFTDLTRIRILHLLKEMGWVNYSQLSKELDVPLSSMSHHIDILVEAGIIERRNEGKRTFFALSPDGIRNAINILNSFI